MPVTQFSVSQIRVAATCPRILYFDAEYTCRRKLKTAAMTRIWTGGKAESVACGSLFHHAIENFNGKAYGDPDVRQILGGSDSPEQICQKLLQLVYKRCVNHELLFKKTGQQQQNFVNALRSYVRELAEILHYALSTGRPVEDVLDEMFGDKRRRLDVTFRVGPDGEPVRAKGKLDYIFHDWRTGRNRIIDYKLIPADDPSKDLFQVSVYGLMHDRQHKTAPDVAVLYLHPHHQMLEQRWEQVFQHRHTVYDLLASMAQWIKYDEKTRAGLKPPGEPVYCEFCKWNKNAQCVRRLGSKDEGQWLTHWSDGARSKTAEEPVIEVAPIHTAAAGRDRPDQRHAATACEPKPKGSGRMLDEDLWIGQLSPEQPVVLPRRVLPTHLAVVGAAGSGKTWLAKVIVEEAILQGVPVVAIDPQGDLVQMARQRPVNRVEPEQRDRYRRYCQRVEPRVLTPGTSHGVRVSLSPIRVPSQAELARIDTTERQAEERTSMLAAVANNLVGLAKAGGEQDSQRTFVFQVLLRIADTAPGRQLRLHDVVAVIQEPDAVGLDDPDRFVRKSEREKLARKLNGLLYGPAAGLFQGGRPLDVGQLRQPETPGKVPLNVFYLNALTDDDRKDFFVAALAGEVYRWMVTSAESTGRPNLLFYLDEARDYIPAGSRKPPAKEPLIRLFTQGRKYGVACLLCTQSPRSVDYNVFGNCSTKIIGRLESAQDVERVAQWFARKGSAPAWLPQRKGAETGSFVARWPRMPSQLEGQAFRTRTLFSIHEGAWPPDRLEHEGQPRSFH